MSSAERDGGAQTAVLVGPPGRRRRQPVKRILVVDDHPIVRDGLKQVVARSGNLSVEGEAGTAEEALALVARDEWDLVVLDITLPGRSGIDLLRDLRRLKPALPVLILSVHPEEEFAVRAIKAGAEGYLRKDCAAADLVAAIEVVLTGRKFISPSVAERLAEDVQRESGRPLHERLSNRELEVVSLIAGGKTTKEIAAILSVSKSSVSTYRQRILEKLSLHSTGEITRYAVEHGLVTWVTG
ncbi:MAG TPA: response regulator transcription factor [Thermoanaerobaculia bacterium]